MLAAPGAVALLGSGETTPSAGVIYDLVTRGETAPLPVAILETPAAAWEGIEELYVETHPWAACGAEELGRHLEAAGFVPRVSAHRSVLRLTRN